MFYEIINNTIHEVDMPGDNPSFGFTKFEELEGEPERMKLLNEYLLMRRDCHTSIDVFDDYSVIFINDTGDNSTDDVSILVLRQNRFLGISLKGNGQTLARMEEAACRFKNSATLEKVVFSALDVLLANANQTLERNELQIIELEGKIVEGNYNENLNKDIYMMRKELANLRSYYEELADIGDELEVNENEIFPENDLRFFNIFTDKARRLSYNAQNQSEDLIHLREALDASINYGMNKIMKLLTIVSAIFLPLTLIVGWYGMNFVNMPELKWSGGYIAVIIFSAIVSIVCIVFMKKKKMF